MNVLIIHDNDQDGYCAANIVAKSFNKADTNHLFIKVGEPFPEESYYSEYDKVVFVDHTPSISAVKGLLANGKKVAVVDHHADTFEAFKDLVDQPNFEFVFEEGVSSAKLAWDRYFPEVAIPYAVSMINKWDIWQHDEDQILPFHYGMECMNMDDPGLWEAILGSESAKACVQILQMGNAVGSFWLAQINDITSATSWVKEVGSVKYAVCNSQLTSTYDLMTFMKDNDCTGAAWYWYDPSEEATVVAIKVLPNEGSKAVSRKEVIAANEINPWLPASN